MEDGAGQRQGIPRYCLPPGLIGEVEQSSGKVALTRIGKDDHDVLALVLGSFRLLRCGGYGSPRRDADK